MLPSTLQRDQTADDRHLKFPRRGGYSLERYIASLDHVSYRVLTCPPTRRSAAQRSRQLTSLSLRFSRSRSLARNVREMNSVR